MKQVLAGLLSAVMLLGLCACSGVSNSVKPLNAVTYPKSISFDDYEARSAQREQNPVDDAFLIALNNFSYKTAAAVLTGSDINVNFSPLSLYYALAVAGTGASGETQNQILSLLGVDDTAVLSEQCANLYRQLYTDNSISKLKIANSLWMDKDLPFDEGFVQNAAKNFYAAAYPVIFTDPSTPKAMGKWVAENTNGTLAPEFQSDPLQILSILNTVYFYDEWLDRFQDSNTASGVFFAPEGEQTVDYMHRTDFGSYVLGDGFTRASLSYKGGGRMVFILPDEGITPADLLSAPDGARALFEEGESFGGEIVWTVPKFSFDSQFMLADTLKALGMAKAFDPSGADFSGLTSEPCYIANIIQGTHISIDEKGTEASAYTEIAMNASAAPPENQIKMTLDRPFLYGITAPNGALLFVGVCQNPAV